LAGRAHILKDTSPDPLQEFRRVNVSGTASLAQAAAGHGVRRLIFISSIGVNGPGGEGSPLTEKDLPRPQNAYAVSKWEAEQVLHKISVRIGMDIVILRLPLVYGPEAPGNFLRLMQLVQSGVPLPLGSINNLRSFIYIGNLLSAISCCITHPAAAGQTFLVSDNQDVSTPDLIRMLAAEMKIKPRLFSLSPRILKILGTISGQGEEIIKLLGTLVVDNSKIRTRLGWQPPFTLEEGIRETVRHCLRQ